MTLNIDPRLMERLRAGLIPILTRATVRGRMFLESGLKEDLDSLNAALPQAMRAKLRSYIGDEPMYDFVFGQLSQELAGGAYESNHMGPLTSIEGFEDSAHVAARLIETLNSLPKRYTLTMRLPAAMELLFQAGDTCFQVAEGVFVRKGDALQGVYQSGKTEQGLLGNLIGGRGAAGWPEESAYLQVEFDGFVGRYVTTESQAEAMEVMYAFLGAALAFRALKHQPTFLPRNDLWHVVVHENEERSCLDTLEVDNARRELLSNLVVDGSVRPEVQPEWLKDCLRRIGYLFSAPTKSRNKLLLGCKWLFDSYCGNDQLLQYIQATVVVETLLGDKATSDQVGLGALLGNRCAYLIGHTSSQRDSLLDDFRDIYDVRSRIVHRGQSRLTRRENELFYKLHWICSRIIQQEAQLLMRDVYT